MDGVRQSRLVTCCYFVNWIRHQQIDVSGYYVHLSTYAEVREEVLHYIPVMARPMVLNANIKPNPTWSPVYADVTDPKLTNWLWVNRQRNTQRERYLIFSKFKDMMSPDEIDKKFVHQQKLVSFFLFFIIIIINQLFVCRNKTITVRHKHIT